MLAVPAVEGDLPASAVYAQCRSVHKAVARRSVDVEMPQEPAVALGRGVPLSPKKSCSTWVIVMGNRRS